MHGPITIPRLLHRRRSALPLHITLTTPAPATCLSCESRISEPQRHNTPPSTCLAAAAPLFTSRALATAPALATSPTNSNGTFPKPRPTRPSSSLLPSISLCRPTCPSLTMLPRRPPHVAWACLSLPHCPSRARFRPAPPRVQCSAMHSEAVSNDLAAMVASSVATFLPRALLRAGCKYPGTRSMRLALTA
jgi:hypothetical protein